MEAQDIMALIRQGFDSDDKSQDHHRSDYNADVDVDSLKTNEKVPVTKFGSSGQSSKF